MTAVGDFAQLLVRYIRHVRDCEGVDFITYGGDGGALEKAFTKNEIALLEKLATLSKDEDNVS